MLITLRLMQLRLQTIKKINDKQKEKYKNQKKKQKQ